jgi:hypothetical protein
MQQRKVRFLTLWFPEIFFEHNCVYSYGKYKYMYQYRNIRTQNQADATTEQHNSSAAAVAGDDEAVPPSYRTRRAPPHL